MKRGLLSFLFLTLCFGGMGPAAAGDLGWDPQHTWAFVVGVLKFQDKNLASWDTVNRRDSQIVSLLRTRGVPQDHILYLADSSATKARIEGSLPEFVRRAQPGDSLILYYTGHGFQDDNGRGYFGDYDEQEDADYDQCWSVDSIVKDIQRNFKGSRALLMADCCTSGSLVQAIKATSGPISYAALSSSSTLQHGNGNWTFSQAILDGFGGNPAVDANHDGKIALKELAQYLRAEMRIFEGTTSLFATTGDFTPETVIADAAPASGPPPERVEVYYNGDWWKARLLERKGNQGKIRWIQLGYDYPEKDEWVDLRDVRPLK